MLFSNWLKSLSSRLARRNRRSLKSSRAGQFAQVGAGQTPSSRMTEQLEDRILLTAEITFDGATDDGDLSITRTVDGVTATFSNAVGNAGMFRVGSTFLDLGTTLPGRNTGFDVTFDAAVNLEQFNVGAADGSATFDVTGPGVNSSNGPGGFSLGQNNFDSGPLALQANQAYTFSNITGILRITGLTFSAAGPSGTTEVTLDSGVLTITDIDGGDSDDALEISHSGGNYTITDTGGLILTTTIAGATGDGTDTLVIPDTGVTGIDFDVLNGDDTVTVNSVQASLSGGFTIDGGAGSDVATLGGAVNTAGGAVTITTDEVNVNAAVTTGGGAVDIQAGAELNFGGSGSLDVESGSPNVTLQASGGAASLTGGAGDPDAMFGTGGTTVTDLGTGNTIAADSVVQSDGKVVVLAASEPLFPFVNELYLVRYNPDGSLDTTFDGDGIITRSASGFTPRLAIQSDGKLLLREDVGGNSNITRFNTDGSVDMSFGTSGTTSIAVGTFGEVVVLDDDRILVAGGGGPNANNDFFVGRLLADGSLDASFGSSGVAQFDAGGDDEGALRTVVQSDGRIILAGSQRGGTGGRELLMMRVEADGSALDASFGTSGIVVTDINGTDQMVDVALQSDGKVLVVNDSGGDLVLSRFNTDGTFDNTFATNGIFTHDAGSTDRSTGVVIQADDHILLTGRTNAAGDQALLLRLDPNGALDAGFGTGGVLGLSGFVNRQLAGVLQSDGHLVIAGSDGTSPPDLQVSRFLLAGAASPGEINLASGATINARGGSLTFTAGTMAIAGSTVSGTGDLTIEPNTTDTTIGLGGGAGDLSLDAAEVTALQDGFNSITIGDVANGTGDITLGAATFLDPVTLAGGSIISSGPALVGDATLDGNVEPDGGGNGQFIVDGNVTLDAAESLALSVDGAGDTPGTTHDQLRVEGTARTVTLNNATLNLTGGGSFAPTGEVVIVDLVDAGSTISGTFNSLAEGATINIGGTDYVISYQGGDGNDVVIAVAPDSFLVTTAVDENDGVGVGNGTSLREAVIAANADPNPSIITFDESLNGTRILLTIAGAEEDAAATGDLDIRSEIIIRGNGMAETVIDGGWVDQGSSGFGDRILESPSGSGANLTIEDLTITGGNSGAPSAGGGGIQHLTGELTIRRSSVSGNTSSDNTAGIYVSTYDDVTISDSVISNNISTGVRAGGISFSGSNFQISNSTISGNVTQGQGGAGVYTYRTPRGLIENTTISNNRVAGNFGNGGGLVSYTYGTIRVVNSTISGNSSPGGSGAVSVYGTLQLTNSTVVGNTSTGSTNTGGIQSAGGTIVLDNTIVAGTTGGTDLGGTGISGSNNLIGDGQNLGTLTNTVTGDPLLSPLQDNGGPTLTHAPFTGSPAENAGDDELAVDADSNPLTTDQRGAGFPRIVDTSVDIGAFEGTIVLPPPATILVTTAVDENDGTFDAGTGSGTSLREAIIAANLSSDANTITFDASLNGTPIVLTIAGTAEDAAADGDLDITGETIIQGNGTSETIIDAGGSTGIGERVLQVLSGGNLTLNGLTVTGGNESDEGGGIFNEGLLTIADSTITGNLAGNDGGALYTSGGTVEISNSALSHNTSDSDGGAIFSTSGDLTITDVTISQNTSDRSGGGILHESGTLTIAGSTISDNTAASNGGGILNRDEGALDITNSTISGNTAGQNAGGISNVSDAVATIKDSFVTGNMATFDGGGLYQSDKAMMTVTNSTISGNSADDGGGVYSEDSSLSIADSTISNNTAVEQGGGLYNSSGNVTVSSSTISGNSSGSESGGLYNDRRSSITIVDSIISNNTSLDEGGGLQNLGTASVLRSTVSGNSVTDGTGGGLYNAGTLTVVDSTISGNSATERAGGIYNDETLTIINSTISGNTAGGAGGGVYSLDSLTVTNSTIANNSATDGGGIYNDDTTATLNNTIVAGSIAGGDLRGNFSGSNNLIQDGSGTGLTGTITGDPLLGPLQDNGGPTFTHALGMGSPAIDAGDNNLAVDDEADPLMTDQRGEGFPRTYPTTVDIGSFEVLPPATIVVTTEVDEDDGVFDPNVGAGTSLREAIIAANISTDVTTITFDPSLDRTPILLTIPGSDEDAAQRGDLDVTTSVIISGNGATNTIIEGSTTGEGFFDRIFDFHGGTSSIAGVTITGGDVTMFAPSPDEAQGGGVLVRDGEVTISESTISGNTALEGGGIAVKGGSLSVIRSSVSNNDGGYFAGGILAANDREAPIGFSLTITDSTIDSNQARFGSGGIGANASVPSSVTIQGSTISNNMATESGPVSGGGVSVIANAREGHSEPITLSIVNSTISGNSAVTGAGLALSGQEVTFNPRIVNSTIANNSATGDGGGIELYGGASTLTIENTILTGNTGGDIFTIADPTVTGSNNLSDDTGVAGHIAPVSGFDSTLADNGGPTLTHALLAGSNAIDAGDNTLAVNDMSDPLETDQRGGAFPRVFNSTVDVGAFEVSVIDFGDAPDTFSTLFESDGARHHAIGPRLGDLRDGELDGQPTASADGDDTTADADEDGISLLSSLVVSATSETTVAFNIDLQNADDTDNIVSAWIDLDGSGTFDDGEQLISEENLDPFSGNHIVTARIPAGTSVGDKVARFRLSTATSVDFDGEATDGEVEDYVFSFTDVSAGATVNLLENAGNAVVALDGDELVVSQGEMELLRVPAAELGDLNIVGSDGDDVVTLFQSLTSFTGNLNIDGGDGNDQINLTGGPLDFGDSDLNLTAEETTLGTDVTTTGDINFFGPALLTTDVNVTGGNVTFHDNVDSDTGIEEFLIVSRQSGEPVGLSVFSIDSETRFGIGFTGELAGLVTTPTGTVLVADTATSSIVEVAPGTEGLPRVDTSVTGPGDPIDLVVTPTGEFLVTIDNEETSRVERFGSDGTHIGTFTTGGGRGIALSPAGVVYVSLPNDESVGVYGLDGTLADNLVTGEEFDPSDIAIDDAGNVYVSDQSSGDIFQFDPTGNFVGSFVSELEGPLGIAFDSAGNLYVTDPEGGRVNRFGPGGSPLGPIVSEIDSPLFLTTLLPDVPPEDFSLTVNSSGRTEFGGPVGSNGPLTSLTTDGGGSTILGDQITVTDTMTFGDPVILDSDTQLTGDVTFEFAIDSDDESGAVSLTVDGSANFNGPVGSTDPLSFLGVTGTTTINGGSITTEDSQSFVDVSLRSDTTLIGSSVTFDGTVDSEEGENNSLTVNASAEFGGDIGSNDPLSTLTVSQDTRITTPSIETTGEQTFTGPVQLETTSTLTASKVTFDSTVDGDEEAGEVSLTVNGDAEFNDTVGDDPLTDLTVNGSSNVDAQITTNRTQSFNGPLTVDGTFDPNGSGASQPVVDGDVTFESTGSFTVSIDGNTPGDDQDQIQVNGTSRTVNIDGTLTVELGEDFAVGSEHVIIDNTDPGSSVSGNFVGLPEGTSFDVNGTTFVITYMGGDGNDVVLLTDVTPPTADVVDVTPDPRVESAGVVTVNFDEPVTGVTIDAFTLTRDETPVSLEGISVVGEQSTYSLDLSSVTDEQGTYVLTLDAEGSGIQDVAGNDLEENASDTWIFAASGAEDDGSGNVTVEDDGGDSNEDLTISSVGGNTQLSDANNAIGAGNGTTQVDPQTIEFDNPPNDVVINGGEGDDTLTIDLRGGNPLPGGTLTFNGGEGGNDTLVIIDDNGTTVISGTYRPDLINDGDGTHTLDLAGGGTLTITFTGLEPTVISGIPNFTFQSPGSEDVITVGSIVEAGADALTVSGTSDGVTFETLVLYDVDNFTIDLGTNDVDTLSGATGNDLLTIAGGLDDGTDIARGLQDLTIDLGTGGTGDVDSLTISADVDVPGTVSIDGTVINSDASIGQDLTIGANAELSPGPETAQLSTGNLTFEAGSSLAIDITDGTPGTGLDQILVTGTVDLTGANLNIDASSSTVGGGDTLVIIDNDGSDAVTGTFADLDEGATVQINGEAFQISYVGGDGNDVVLTNLPIASIDGPEGPVEEGEDAVFTITLNEPSTDPVTVVLSIDDGTATVGSGDYSAITAPGVAPAVTFAPGETSKTVTVPVNADGSKEADEDFSVSLLTGFSASLNQNGGGSATVTIAGSELQIAPVGDQRVAPGGRAVDLVVASASSDDSPASLSAGDLPSFVSFTDNGDGTGTFTFDPTDEDVESTTEITLTATDGNGSLQEMFSVDVVAPETMLPAPPLVRINAGGGAVGDFAGDQSFNTGNRFSTRAAIDVSSVEGVPAGIFQSTRFDRRGGAPLSYSIPTGPGDFQVNLFFAEIYGPAARVGGRVFDVSIEGDLVLDDFDVFATAGAANKGIVESFNVVSDGTINIDFGHVVENPDIMGIEIIDLNEIVNVGPTLGTIHATTITAGSSTTISVSATDTDGDAVTLSADGLPEFASFMDHGNGTGTVTVNSTADDAGEYPITIQASSGGQPLTDSASFLLTVDPISSEGGSETDPQFGGSVTNGGTVTATSGVRIDGPSDPVAEGDDAVFTVSLDAPAESDVTVTLSVDDGSATVADGDFLPLTTDGVDPAIVFSPGEQSKLVSIETLTDLEGELDETFSVSLVAASGVSIDEGNSSATATIEGGALAVSPIGDQVIAAGTGPVDLVFSSISSDGLPAMLSAGDLPSYASFTDNGDGTATLTLNPTDEDTGEESIEITATDSNASVMQEFNLDIVAPELVEQATSIFRINAAGGAAGRFSGDQLFNTGNRFSTRAGIDLSDESLPEGTPAAIFQTTRWDARGGAPLSYNIPTGEGNFEVILYFAEIYGPTSRVGARVFDVSIEGNVELDNFDVFAEAGAANKGIARRFDVVSDGTLNIEFGHVVENPNVMAIEIIDRTPIANTGPVVAPVSDQSVDEGATLNIPVSTFDNDGDDIMLSILGLPDFASFTDNGDGTGSIEVNPQDGDDGDFLVSVNAESGEQGLTDSTALRISVADALDEQG